MLDTKLTKSSKLAKFIIFFTIFLTAIVIVGFYPRMEKLVLEKQKSFQEEVNGYSTGTNPEYNQVASVYWENGAPLGFYVQQNTVNYAVEACYYLYGRMLQEAKGSAVAFEVLDTYGWINDFYTLNQETHYYAEYKGIYGKVTDTNIMNVEDEDYYSELLDEGILRNRINELAGSHNIRGAFILEFDQYGKISKVDFIGAGGIKCDLNLYAKARESVLQYEENALSYMNTYGKGADTDLREVLPSDFRAVFLLPADSKFWNPFSVTLEYYMNYFNSAENFYVEIGAPILILVAMIFVALVALLLPFIKRLNTGWEKLFSIPLEVVICLIIADVGLAYMMFMAMSHSMATGFAGASVVVLGYVFDSNELYGWALAGNVLGWALFLLIEYVVVAQFRQFLCGPVFYLKKRILVVRFCGWVGSKIKQGYHNLVDVNLNKGMHRTILKMVVINFLIVSFFCSFRFAGIVGLFIYSVILYFLFRSNGRKVEKRYNNILHVTEKMAEGELKVELQEDLGFFTPLGEELARVQEGFSKAVDEEAKSQKMKTELISNVSHDLKTPLTAIITYVNLLKQENIPEETRRKYIDTLDMKSQRLKALIEDLFEVSKAQSGNIQMNYMDVDVVNLIKQLRLEMEDKIADSNVIFRWNLPEEKVVLWLDGQRTYRVFENLLSNALKYALDGSRVFVDVINKDEEVEVVFKNISSTEIQQDAERLTERFVRGEASRTSEGSGLGLAIVKNFVELQGGTFKIEIDGDLFKAVILWKKGKKQV